MSRIISISGVTCAGKRTLAEGLLASVLGARIIPSVTTRQRRQGDLPGAYRYVDSAVFQRGEDESHFVWAISHANQRYATRWEDLNAVLSDDLATGIVILTPEKVGSLYRFVRETRKDTNQIVPLFLQSPPDLELLERMRRRGDLRYDQMQHRIIDERDLEMGNARVSTIPFRYIRPGSIEDTLAAALTFFEPLAEAA